VKTIKEIADQLRPKLVELLAENKDPTSVGRHVVNMLIETNHPAAEQVSHPNFNMTALGRELLELLRPGCFYRRGDQLISVYFDEAGNFVAWDPQASQPSLVSSLPKDGWVQTGPHWQLP
jgi:hypothetical protein